MATRTRSIISAAATLPFPSPPIEPVLAAKLAQHAGEHAGAARPLVGGAHLLVDGARVTAQRVEPLAAAGLRRTKLDPVGFQRGEPLTIAGVDHGADADRRVAVPVAVDLCGALRRGAQRARIGVASLCARLVGR